ncbi:MAG: hypothetical protein K8I60_08110 [Anaerolineae bacterium]|nr:hypothetical protein [Anaerolineae bacterium]
MERQARLTSELKYDVDRLNRQLDQRISDITEVREIVDMMAETASLMCRIGTPGDPNTISSAIDEIEIKMNRLTGLVNAIGDNELKDTIKEMLRNWINLLYWLEKNPGKSPTESKEYSEFRGTVMNAHEHIYRAIKTSIDDVKYANK